jgi:hypothetical protein
MSAGELLQVYDLRDHGAWQRAHRHRRLWGRPFTDVHTLDTDHIALVFRAGGERWQAWERARLEWILKDAEAAA